MSKKDNNPSLSEAVFMANMLEILDTNNCLPDNAKEIVKSVEASIVAVKASEEFNHLFKCNGWAINDYLPAECIVNSVNAVSRHDLVGAELILIDGVSAALDMFIMHLQSAPEFQAREKIFSTAKRLYETEEYLAVIPLLLIAMDGTVNDIANLGLFAQGVDLDVWDSITQHSEALSYIHSEFLTKNRTKTNKEEISLPYRNGILHGRDINFGNKLLAAKCWNLLFILRTWYRDKQDVSYKLKQRAERENSHEKSALFQRYVSSFVKRRYSFNIDFLENSPSNTCYNFLQAWKNKQWGKIVPLMSYSAGKHIGKEAKSIKDIYEKFILDEFSISEIEHNAAYVANVLCRLVVKTEERIEKYTLMIRCVYSDDQCDILPDGHPEGRWYVIQNSLSKILFKKHDKEI